MVEIVQNTGAVTGRLRTGMNGETIMLRSRVNTLRQIHSPSSVTYSTGARSRSTPMANSTCRVVSGPERAVSRVNPPSPPDNMFTAVPHRAAQHQIVTDLTH